MNNKLMLFECLNCEETYLADNMCDGYNCPRCNGYVTERGFLDEIEERTNKMQDQIIKAKINGLIRYYKTEYLTQAHSILYADGKETTNLIGGVDLSKEKDFTTNINVNIEDVDKDKLIEEMIKKLYDPKKPRRSGVIE